MGEIKQANFRLDEESVASYFPQVLRRAEDQPCKGVQPPTGADQT